MRALLVAVSLLSVQLLEQRQGPRDRSAAREAHRDRRQARERRSAPCRARRPTGRAGAGRRRGAADTRADVAAARTAKLRILAGYFESKVVKLSHELHISIEDTLDEYGRVSDPVKLCSQIQSGYVDRYGSDGAQVAMVRAFGSELGTQVFRGTLCEGPPVARGLVPPSMADLTSAFSDRILRDTVGWSKRLDISLDNLIDENGHVKDIGAVAHREHERLDQKSGDWERAISLFGNEFRAARSTSTASGDRWRLPPLAPVLPFRPRPCRRFPSPSPSPSPLRRPRRRRSSPLPSPRRRYSVRAARRAGLAPRRCQPSGDAESRALLAARRIWSARSRSRTASSSTTARSA